MDVLPQDLDQIRRRNIEAIERYEAGDRFDGKEAMAEIRERNAEYRKPGRIAARSFPALH